MNTTVLKTILASGAGALSLLPLPDRPLLANNNDAYIDQAGPDNSAQQSQTGPYNSASIEQVGTDTGKNDATQTQTNNSSSLYGSKAVADQTGKLNKATQTQVIGTFAPTYPGYANTGMITQSGDNNVATQSQTRNNTVLGVAGNVADVEQTGSTNTSGQTQTGNRLNATVDQLGNDNQANQAQTGNQNTATIDQDGDDNTATQSQANTQNTATAFQTGTLNTSSQTQIANNPNQNTSLIDQAGDNNMATLVQERSSNIATILQTEDWHQASQLQTGTGNSAFIDQSGVTGGPGNTATQQQTRVDAVRTGSNNNAKIYQANSNNAATQQQLGSISSTALIRQDYIGSVGNTAFQVQTGNNNAASASLLGGAWLSVPGNSAAGAEIHQEGASNSARQEQSGNSNEAHINQSGSSAIAVVGPVAFGGAVGSKSFTYGAEQTQAGNFNLARIYQETGTTGNAAIQIQSLGSNGNIAAITQGGEDGRSYQEQGGTGGHKASIDQGGDLNRAAQMQGGGSNTATITQTGTNNLSRQVQN